MLAGCGSSDPPIEPEFAFIEQDADGRLLLTLVEGEREERTQIESRYRPLGALGCTGEGLVALDAVISNRLTSPLVLDGDEVEPLDWAPAGVGPAWFPEGRLAYHADDGAGNLYIAIAHLAEESVERGPRGRLPAWVPGLGLAAFQGGPPDGYDRIGVYTYELSGDAPPELLSSLPFPTDQLSPDGTTFVYLSASQENAQRDLLAIGIDGGDHRTLTATPEQEEMPRWTADGDVIFVRQPLLDQRETLADARDALVVRLDPASGDERVIATAGSVLALAPCH
ncbi:MAG: hypothetical protein GEU28_08990 [Dehalococcoidia bacterium]|nr:hypothetical protein [Dehalococcoidia bacterium]